MSAPSVLARASLPAAPEPGPRAPRRLAVVPDPQPPAPPVAGAAVLQLFPPSDRAMAAPLRLTRRGVAVVAVAVAVLAIAVVALAARSARVPERAAAPARVTVGPGDTLWSVATRVAPQTDPRAEVSLLQRLNHLAGSTVQPGQVLRTRPPA